MGEPIVLDFSLPSLNVWQRMHWTKRRKIKEKIKWLIVQARPKRYEEKVFCLVVRYGRKLDKDNLYASFKPLGDALIAYGVTRDDTSEWLDYKMVQKKGKARTEIWLCPDGEKELLLEEVNPNCQ